MSALLLRAATAVVRGWTRLYTRGLAPDVRARRRAEIESELWECRAAARRPASDAAQILIRLVLGVVDDVGWSMENRRAHPRRSRRTIAVAAGAAVLLTLIWIGAAFTVEPVPPPPAPQFTTRRVAYPPPPPPPPPPCRLADPSPTPPCK
jgi:hypothetical protein